MHQKPAIGTGIAALVGVFCLASLASDTSRIEKPAAVDAEQYADLIENEVFDIQDLAEGAEIQRRMFNRITPPGFSWVQPMFPPVVPFDASNFDEKFLDELLGEDKNSVAIYPLLLTQDPKTRETLVYNADGKLIASIPADRVSREWPEDADPARVTLQLDLLPSEDVEPYLYTESLIAEYEETRTAKTKKSGGMVLRSLGASEFGIAGVQRLTNGNTQITVTNGTDASEVLASTVWHTSSVSVVVWTNEFDEVLTNSHTAWHPVSPAFDAIESAWVSLTSSLPLSNGVGVFMDTDTPDEARVRFYAAAQLVDSDGDGISDGEEIFLYRTDPNDAADFPAIPELDAALADVNALQMGYLAYLVEQAAARSSGPLNYAQQIQQMRSSIEGVLGSFLDLDVNQGGVLAEGSQVVTWTLPTVLASVGNSSGTWLGGMVTPAHFQEIAAVLAKLTHLVHEVGYHSGYSHQAIASNASPVLVDDWDLGTGYPPSWPQSQPIRTYLLFHNTVSIPSVGDGTIDDWIKVNGERFPASGSIYFNHVAEITAPIWNASGANTLELWDCGDCAGENNHAYLSPFTVLHVLEVPILSVNLEIDGVSESEELSVGAVIVRNHDGNIAPRRKITLHKADPSDSFDIDLLLTRSSSKTRVFSAATGGAEIIFNGADNKFSNSQLPIDLFVQGATASDVMCDATLALSANGYPNVFDEVSFTVLWVDISIRTSGNVSDDNAAKQNYISTTGADGFNFRIYNLSGTLGVEFVGTVSPSDFDQYVVFRRNFLGSKEYSNGVLRSCDLIPRGDTSSPAIRDDDPQSGGSAGKIYDLDAPGVLLLSEDPGDTEGRRVNFEQWATFTIGEDNIRCSPIRPWFLRINVEMTTNYDYILSMDVAGDNQISEGSTSLEYDLQ